MNNFRGAISILSVLMILGCSSGSEPNSEQADTGEEATTNDHVWKEQVETIDRAKGVEDTIMEADEAKRKAMEDAGGG